MIFARFLSPVLKGGDECHWYFIEIMIDTTIGVYVEFWLLMRIIDGFKFINFTETAGALAEHAASHSTPTSDAVHDHESPTMADIKWCRYTKQVVTWLVIVTIMKGVMVTIMVVEAPQLTALAQFILKPVDSDPNVELVLVMVLTPAIMNSLQFWLQDNIFVDAAKTVEEERRMQKMLEKEAEEEERKKREGCRKCLRR